MTHVQRPRSSTTSRRSISRPPGSASSCAGGCPSAGSSSVPSSGIALALVGRRGLARADDRLPRPAVRAARRRPDPEPRDEPADGRRDHPLRGGAEARVRRRAAFPVSQLRSSISTRELLAAGQLRGINPLMEITVKGSGQRKVELAADALARARRPSASPSTSPRRSTLLKQQIVTSRGAARRRSTSASRRRRSSRRRSSPTSRSRSTSGCS